MPTQFVTRYDFRLPGATPEARREQYARALEQVRYLDEHGADPVMLSEHHMSEDGYLETPRQWLAGYRAWVDGVPVEPLRAKSGMLGLPVKAGPHSVVLAFTGSARLWTGLVISAAALIGVVLGALMRPGWPEAYKEGFSRWIEANRT